MSPTGPKIKRSSTVDEISLDVRRMLVNVQQVGSDITIDFTLSDGRVVGLTFGGAPFKGKTIETIDAALTWELGEFAKRMGWE